MNFSDPQNGKRAAGIAAAALVEDGMLVGLGTGSTATFFIESLIERCRTSDLQIQAIATSDRSARQAAAGGIALLDPATISTLDITVDGADEIDKQKRMIKGGGGALLREKIVATSSGEMIVIVDESKVVDHLGGFPLPLEVAAFAYNATLYKVCSLGYDGAMRKTKDGQLYITDNGNYIIDITFPHRCISPEKDQAALKAIPGILETGFFLGIAGRVIVGQNDGTTYCF